eukprot:6158697-Amphidinium_carterae.1
MLGFQDASSEDLLFMFVLSCDCSSRTFTLASRSIIGANTPRLRSHAACETVPPQSSAAPHLKWLDLHDMFIGVP